MRRRPRTDDEVERDSMKVAFGNLSSEECRVSEKWRHESRASAPRRNAIPARPHARPVTGAGWHNCRAIQQLAARRVVRLVTRQRAPYDRGA